MIHMPHAPSFDIVKFRSSSLYRRWEFLVEIIIKGSLWIKREPINRKQHFLLSQFTGETGNCYSFYIPASPVLGDTLLQIYNTKGPENIKVALYWCTGSRFTVASWHSNSCWKPISFAVKWSIIQKLASENAFSWLYLMRRQNEPCH